jgi:uncharacterized coiled-coil protein SlyX
MNLKQNNMNLTKVKDLVKKYFTQAAITIALVLLLAGSVYMYANTRTKLQLVQSELKASKSLNSIVEKEKIRLDSLAKAYKVTIAERDALIAKNDKRIANQWAAIAKLQDSLRTALAENQEVKADSSYKYINWRIPPITELKYSFDSSQVKRIHYTFLERDGFYGLNLKLNSVVDELKLNSSVKDSQIVELKSLNGVYISKLDICDKEKGAYKTEIEGLNKNVKKQKFFKNTANVAIVGLVTYIVIHSISH